MSTTKRRQKIKAPEAVPAMVLCFREAACGHNPALVFAPPDVAEDPDVAPPADDEPFSGECVPGYCDGDYPLWVAAVQERYVPEDLLRECGTREDSSFSASRCDPGCAACARLRSDRACGPELLVAPS